MSHGGRVSVGNDRGMPRICNVDVSPGGGAVGRVKGGKGYRLLRALSFKLDRDCDTAWQGGRMDV